MGRRYMAGMDAVHGNPGRADEDPSGSNERTGGDCLSGNRRSDGDADYGDCREAV